MTQLDAEQHVYMKAIMKELGVETPKEARDKVRAMVSGAPVSDAVKRYRVPEKWLLSSIGGAYDKSHGLAVVVLDSDYEEARDKISALEDEHPKFVEKMMDKARDEALEEAAKAIDSVVHPMARNAAAVIRAMKYRSAKRQLDDAVRL